MELASVGRPKSALAHSGSAQFSGLTLLTSVHWGKPLHTHLSLFSPLTLLTSVHWGKPLHVFIFDIRGIRGWSFYELNDGIPLWAFSRHAGPGVCVSAFLFGITHTRLRITL